MVTPVILRAMSDARKTAVEAMSLIEGISFNMVSAFIFLKTSSTPAAPLAIASLKGRESSDPPERMLTTLTPDGPSSQARFLEKASIAQQTGPKPPTPGYPIPPGVAVND